MARFGNEKPEERLERLEEVYSCLFDFVGVVEEEAAHYETESEFWAVSFAEDSLHERRRDQRADSLRNYVRASSACKAYKKVVSNLKDILTGDYGEAEEDD